MDTKRKNIADSIVLIGPCGVGKSLIAAQLSQRIGVPLLDIDDLLFFIEADLREELSHDTNKQKRFIEEQIKDLRKLEREKPLSDGELTREKELVYEFVDLYNYYFNLLGGFERFYPIFYEYYKSTQKFTTRYGEISKLNNATLQLLEKIFESTSTNFVISPPASFGWVAQNPFHIKTQALQNKIGEFLNATHTVLLQPGDDYCLRIPADKSSVNYKLFLKHLERYYKHADLELSTNGLFYEPENDFLKQRTWLNVRETMTKEKLKNSSEINNITDQIVEYLENYIENDEEIF